MGFRLSAARPNRGRPRSVLPRHKNKESSQGCWRHNQIQAQGRVGHTRLRSSIGANGPREVGESERDAMQKRTAQMNSQARRDREISEQSENPFYQMAGSQEP